MEMEVELKGGIFMADLSVKKYEGMSPAQLETEMVGRDIAFAKKGIFIALLGAALWGLYGVFMGQAYTCLLYTSELSRRCHQDRRENHRGYGRLHWLRRM